MDLTRNDEMPRRRRYPGLFSYIGGKARIAAWIVANLPPHEVYVEPFCGGARVLFAKHRSRVEVINDLDQGVVSAMRAARDHPEALATLLALTPYARKEYERAVEDPGYDTDTLEGARRFFVAVGGAFLACATNRKGGWRIARRCRQEHGSADRRESGWARLPELVLEAADRLRGVPVECRDAFELIPYFDGRETLFYCDPPYHPGACNPRYYRHALDVDDHRRLADLLHGVQGMVVLSAYKSADYDEWYAGWPRLERATCCAAAAGAGGAWKRREVLWFNPLAWSRRADAEADNGRESCDV